MPFGLKLNITYNYIPYNLIYIKNSQIIRKKISKDNFKNKL